MEEPISRGKVKEEGKKLSLLSLERSMVESEGKPKPKKKKK